MAERAALRQVVARQAEQIAILRAERGRHVAELARADTTLVRQATSHARVRRQVRRLRSPLTAIRALAIAAVAPPAWVR